jgi:hypothetical protein
MGRNGKRLKRPKIELDALLAPLISLVWAHGIDTCQCCQEVYSGIAEIEFPGSAEVAEFLWIAQREYKVEAETWDEGADDDGQHVYGVRLLVLFPTIDIPALVEAFKAAVGK